MKKNSLCSLYTILLFCLFSTQLSAQWTYPSRDTIKEEIIINYEVVYEKQLSEAQKKHKNYIHHISVVFNKRKLKYQAFYTNNQEYIPIIIFDYQKEKVYNYKQFKSKKYGYSLNFRTPSKAVSPTSQTTSILNLNCSQGIVKIKGIPKTISYTKDLGLRFCLNFNVDGFLLEYPGYHKELGHFKVKARSINYRSLNSSIFSLKGVEIVDREEVLKEREKIGKRLTKIKSKVIGKPHKKFKVTTLEDNEISSKELTGEIIILNFWARNCLCIRKGIDKLNELKKKYANQKINFISIALNPNYNLNDLNNLKTSTNFKFEMIPDGMWLADKFDIISSPTNIVIDKQGIVQFYEAGYGEKIIKKMNQQIEKALAE